jgi:hypothetical protein
MTAIPCPRFLSTLNVASSFRRLGPGGCMSDEVCNFGKYIQTPTSCDFVDWELRIFFSLPCLFLLTTTHHLSPSTHETDSEAAYYPPPFDLTPLFPLQDGSHSTTTA